MVNNTAPSPRRVAPSVRRLVPGLRAFWVGISGLLSLAIPVVIAFGLLYAACHDGGCFS